MKYDLNTKEGIHSFINNELNFTDFKFKKDVLNVKGLVTKLYKKEANSFKNIGYELEDLFNEAYIWIFEKIEKKKDIQDVGYLQKLITLEIKNRMSNLLRKSWIEQKRILNHKLTTEKQTEYLESLVEK